MKTRDKFQFFTLLGLCLFSLVVMYGGMLLLAFQLLLFNLSGADQRAVLVIEPVEIGTSLVELVFEPAPATETVGIPADERSVAEVSEMKGRIDQLGSLQ